MCVQMVMGRDGQLTIDDFVVASMNQYRNLSDAVIKNMFSHLDTDDDGWITPDDAYNALQPSGLHITLKELRKLFDKYGVKRRMGETQAGKGALRACLLPDVVKKLLAPCLPKFTSSKRY